MLLWFWRCQSCLVFAGIVLSEAGGCKSVEKGRVVFRYALLVVCGIQTTQRVPFAVVMVTAGRCRIHWRPLLRSDGFTALNS